MADPASWFNVVLQLPLTGANNGTTFADQSESSHTVTPLDTARTYSDGAAPGGSSLLLDSDAAGLYITGTLSDFQFGTGDFTVETFATLTSLATSGYVSVLMHYSGSGSDGEWGLFIDENGQPIWSRIVSSAPVYLTGTGTAVSTSERVHVAYCRASGTGRLFLRGVQVASAADTLNYNSASPTELSFSEYFATPETSVLGRVGQTRICREALYTSGFTPPTAEFAIGSSDPEGAIAVGSPLGSAALLSFDVFGLASVASPLGGAALLSRDVNGLVTVGSPLGSVLASGLFDFTALIDASAPNTYVCDLVTPGGPVRVPISSWQATLRAGEMSYVQVVIPACTPLVDDIVAATEFVVYRIARLTNGEVIEYEMARAPAQTKPFDQGPGNHTCTLSGYVDGLPEQTDPPVAYDRTLTGIRSQHSGDGSYRVRCAIDWFLRPGQRAYVEGVPFIVGYINYYVPGFDQYMDVGEAVI